MLAAAVAIWWLLPISVVIVAPFRGPAVHAVYATGTVEATAIIPVAGRVTARLAAILVDEGAKVSKGQLLAQFDDADLQQTISLLSAQENFAKQAYDRAAKLVEGGIVAQSVYDQALSVWRAAKAAMARAELEAKFLKLEAPVDGTIIQRDGEVGELIPASQAVFYLSGNEPLRISSSVDEEDIALVQVGQPVLIGADAFPGKVFHGRVQAITPKGDSVARSYRVRIEMTETTPLRIGMTAETNIIVRKDDNALLLPTSAVKDGKVWVVRDDRLAEQVVATGVVGNERVEILSGLTESDQVVLAPEGSFEVGARVKANESASE